MFLSTNGGLGLSSISLGSTLEHRYLHSFMGHPGKSKIRLGLVRLFLVRLVIMFLTTNGDLRLSSNILGCTVEHRYRKSLN
jgi:hypothetical protein